MVTVACVGSSLVGGRPGTQVVKRLWEHIKANELQKPSDKRTIINDAVLKKLAGVDEMTMFSMNKLLKHHFIKE